MSSKFEFTLSSQTSIDVYISSGWQSSPHDESYEIAIKGQNYVKIESEKFLSLSTFTAAVKVNGIEFYWNKFHQNKLMASFDI